MRQLMKKLIKAALWTDSHWGRKQNSEEHNQDCMNFVLWFIEQIKKDPTIDHLVFLGDFFETRSAINLDTLNRAYTAVKLLDDLNLPIFFIVGNHDLYFRHNRSVFSTRIFDNLKNFQIIDRPTFIKNVGTDGALFCPYLFHAEFAEYRDLINSSPVVFSHLEYKGFVMTGETYVLDHGPDPDDFAAPKKIFCGHFHKRQNKNNIYYIGSNMAMDFADANDTERGFGIYDYVADTIKYSDWPDGPTYIKTSLSALMNDISILRKDATVKCLADEDITLEESSELKGKFMSAYKLRDFNFEEPSVQSLIEDTNMDLSGLELEKTNKIVVTLLERIPPEGNIDPEQLIKIYTET
jgi:DNA repair exonuclease SbcCD nuclease subunit